MTAPRSQHLVLLGSALILLGYVFYPMMMMGWASFSDEGVLSLGRYADILHWKNFSFWEAAWNSVVVSLVTVVLSAIVGCIFAVVLTQCEFPGKKILSTLAVLPIGLPPLVGVISFLFVFGESGILPRFLKETISSIGTFGVDGIPGIILVHVYSFYVYFYLFLATPLRNLDASVLEAASSLGASSRTTFIRVVLPDLSPALMSASMLTFMASMASFTAPFLFGGDKRFLTTLIYSTKLNGDIELAAAQSVLLGTISVAFFAIMGKAAKSYRSGGKGTTRKGTLLIGKRARRFLIGLTTTLFGLALLPVLTIIVISFAKEGAWTWQILPSAYTLENYTGLFVDPNIFQPVGNSISMALLTLCFCVVVGVTAAYALVRGRVGRWRGPLEVLVNFPFALPGTIIAIGLLIAFNESHVLAGFSVMVGSYWILPLAYFARSYPLVIRSTSTSLHQLDESLVEAAQILGGRFWARFRRVVLPLIAPGIISGGLLVMISSLGEFVSSILLYSFHNEPIAVEILSQMRMYNFGGAAAYSVFLLILILGCVGIASRLTRHLQFSSHSSIAQGSSL